ncbi:non-ribosomal peptide synthetase, partial [Pseudomonas viridiflava]|uniref:non-ribosomal peptide synthetase n=1 Tax=Pseudomonas viridiflava TaxID=33069 RepID=UPI000F04D172
LDVLGQELQGILLGDHAQLAEPVPYRNYIAQVLQGPDDAAHEAFFREQLGDIDEPTLPYGLAFASQEDIPHEARLVLDDALCHKVRDQSRLLGVSAASLMHLAWAQVLGHLSGRESVVFGTVLLGRLHGTEGVERALGVFINTLPLRIELGSQSVRDAVLDTHRRLTGLLTHEHAQLALAQRCSALPAGAPLFNTLLNYRHSAAHKAADNATVQAWQGIEVLNAEERSNYPLTLSVDDLGEGFSFTAQATPGIEPQRICDYLHEALTHVILALEQQPDTDMTQLAILPAAERQELLSVFNDTRRDYPRKQPVHRLFEQRAARHPDRVAAEHGQRSMTYGELNGQANRLAHYLIEQGIAPDDHVAIVLPRSMELLIGQLAVSKCAATFVPLDVNAPAERQSYMLDDCQAVCVLTRSTAAINAATRRIDLDNLDLNGQPSHDPALAQAQGSDTAAYVMYTSGSTGAPKGVRVPHRGIARLVLNNGYADFNEHDRIAFASNPAFDASTMEVWGALLNGGQLCVVDHETLVDPVRFSALLIDARISVLFITTALFNQYVQQIPQALQGLRLLLSGGERADPASYRTLLSQAQGLRLFNGYGPTETTTFAAVCEVSAICEGDESVPIGRPIGNTSIYVLDAHQRLAPKGVTGELYIGGDGVALGYLNRPELSVEKFLVDPFSDEPGAMMYRTGDLGRWMEDGQLECLGRNDDQVKIRGFRIELGEIVSCLHQLPGIGETVVLAREDEPGNVRLVAYYTSHEEDTLLAPEQMRAHLQASLPDYMVPTAFIELKTLPLTANGKLDRRALPKPERSALFGVSYEAPEGEFEVALAEIWAEVLQVERVGRHDHFFDLGGHSLLAMRMVSQVRQQLGVELPLGELFALGELAAVAAALSGVARSELPSILPVKRDQPMPLSFAQQRLWFLAQMDGGNEAYNIPMALSLEGALDVTALTRALARIVERHETLRSRFVASGDSAQVLFVPTPADARLLVEDIRHAPLSLDACLRAEAVAPFDLAHGPLIRARLLQVADERHVLLLTVHHIVADGWSMGVLTQELLALYPAFCQEQPDPLPPLAIQYADYAVWQRRWLTGERLQHQAAYWRQVLEGAPTLLTLPTDRPRPAQQDFAGASLALQLDTRLAADLRKLAQRQGVTLYMALMAAWAMTLTRLSGQAEVVIGSPVAGRGRTELEDLVGLFVNTLAVRIDTSGSPSGEALLAQVKARVLEAQDHQDLPFEQVVEVVRPTRSLAHAPLFQTTLNWMPGKHVAVPLGGLVVAPVEQISQVSKFDLSLNLSEQGETLVGSLDYATALFDEATAQRYLNYFVQILETLATHEHTRLDRVALVGEQERRYLLETLNATAVGVDNEQTVHAIIEARAASAPESVAAQVGERRLNYGELNLRANALAHHLISLGVRTDDRVAVMARRGLDTLVAMLAVLKSGAGYVPVDPSHPDERIAYLLSDSAPKVVLTQQALLARVPELAAPVIAFDQPTWPERLDNPQVAGLTSANLAYVIYTSGSTGQPKGVMVEHRTLNNLIDWHCQAFDLHAGSHTASVAGFGFDAMAWEVWPALCAGATLHLPPAEVSNEQLDALLDWWIAQPLQVAFLPTPVAEYAFSRDLRHPTLRTLLIGGDRLRQFHRDPGFAVINNYGPTEATVVATSGRLLPDGSLDIGKPIANTRVYLLDERQQLVPLGVAGELYVAGDSVARGYLNRPEMTAERFLRDPFHNNPEARMYRTGDLARWNANGTLEYLGRNDDQVKIRGVRIELGEIEAQLSRLPGIEEALVVAREDEPGQPRLVGYFTEQADVATLNVGELRTALLAVLPGYMVPSALVRLDAWPLTANGKVDRRALPVPDRDALNTGEYQAPQGELEVALAAIWSELLQVERVGRHDRFFELGGHSLLAMRMVSQVRQRLSLELALGDLFADSALAAVARCLGSTGRSELPAIQATRHDEPVPLSFAQQRLWFLAQMEDANSAYNIPLGLQLNGHLDTRALKRALERIVVRHDSLRSRFIQQEGEARVQAAPVSVVPYLLWQDLRGQDEQALQCVVREEAAQPFDLLDDLPIRGRLLCLAEDRHVLLLTLHHIVADGWSLGVFTRELTTLYRAFSQGLDDPLPPLALQYADYTLWQRDWLDGERMSHQSDYWHQALSGAPALLTLPTDRPRPARQDYSGASVAVRLDPRLCDDLKTFCQLHAVTPFMLFMGAWAVLLARLSGQSEVVIGMPVANRRRSEVEELIGLFVNTLAVRIDTSGEPDVSTLLARIKSQVIQAQEHQDLPFEQVVERLRPPRSLAHSPLFQASLAWDGSQGLGLQLGDLHLQPLSEQPTFAKFDLTLSMGETDEGFGGVVDYATALFDESTVVRYVGYLEQLLWTMVGNAHAVPARAGLLGPQERRRLLVEFNASEQDFQLDQPLQALFEAQVARTPDAVALESAGVCLSYRQLNEAANRLAHHLIGQGVQTESRVAVCLQRGPQLVVGLLAVLKAGGAYVPLDPGYPMDRLAYMLGDSEAVALLVDGTTQARFADRPLPQVNLDSCTWNTQSPESPVVQGLAAGHLAYVIYTSGSTGAPKGVMVEHRGLCNLVQWSSQLCPPVPNGALLHKTPVSFDASVWELFWPLCAGMRLVLARPDGQRDPAYLVQEIQDRQVSVVQFVPALLQQFVDLDESARCVSLTDIVCGGGELTAAMAAQVRLRLPQVRLHNVYGPTEATVDCSVWTLEPHDPVPESALPIGRAISNTRLYVLDDYDQPVPQGVVGQLHIGGDGVTRGYLNLPDMQAERFIDSPFVPGDRLYRSGDLVRQRADGQLEFLGRNDFQVKLHGLRIELGEIEARLSAHPAMREVAVLLHGERLVAWFSCREGHSAPGIEALRAHVLAQLPDYMVPTAYVALSALPLSLNGKLDRAALPEPDASAVLSRRYEAPLCETEALLAELWAELLNVARVGRQDHFFELGGHSLLAVTLIARMRKLGMSADIRVLFAQPTLAALASAVGTDSALQIPANRIDADCRYITPDLLPLVQLDQEAIDRIVAHVPGGAANVQDIYPVGPLQAGILYHHLAAGDSDPYLLQPRFTFADETRLDAFCGALQQVIERHDILRTALFWEGLQAPVQVVWRKATLRVDAVELQDLDDAPRMDLTQAPLLHLVHAHDPATGLIAAALRFHHVVMDHVALDVLGQELQGILLGDHAQLAEPVPYRNYIAQVLQGPDDAAHE